MAAAWESAPLAAAAPKRAAWESAPLADAAPASFIDRAGQAAREFGAGVVQGTKDLGAGLVRGAGSIGATLLAPGDAIQDAMFGKPGMSRNDQRRADMTGALQSAGANPDSFNFGTGKLTSEIAGTLGTGNALANTARAVAPRMAVAAPQLMQSLRTGGMSLGPSTNSAAVNALTRVAGGAATGGASASLVNPDDARTGAVVGGALPGAIKAAGAAGKAIGSRVMGSALSPEVKALAARAEQLGIEIPADRLTDSKPLNAVASGLNYVPFSGRAATEARMERQLNSAVSKLIGQDTPNMTKALRDASADLGAKFDSVLKNTGVVFDQQLLNDATAVVNTAQKELGSDAFKVIGNQLDELVSKGANGVIDGQAAYNIKRTLDRVGRGSGPEAHHATELKKVLMGALDRSLGPKEAAAFAKTRQQYGNMLELEKIAKNGAEGDISVARLANLKNINNKPLQEIADIAAQFIKPREGQHGAAQRGGAALGIGGFAGLPVLAGTVAGGRAANTVLNSNTLRSLAMGQPMAIPGAARLSDFAVRSAPALVNDQ